MSNATSEKTADANVTIAAPSRNFGHPISIIATVLVIFIISQFIGVFAVELLGSVIGSQSASGTVLSNSIAAQFFYILIAEGLTVLGILFVVRQRGLGLAQIGLGRRPSRRDVGMAAVAFVGFIISLILVTTVISALWHGYNANQTQDVGFKTVATSSDKILAFASLVLLPPLGEEPLMRGYLFGGLRSRWNFVAAGLATSLLFGAAHLLTGDSGLLWAAGIDTFVLSLFLVYLRERTGALYAGMLVHAFNNVLAFIVYFHS